MNEKKTKLTLEAVELAIDKLKATISKYSNTSMLRVRDDLVPTTEKTVIEYTDEYGVVQNKAISGELLLDMVEIATNRIVALGNMYWILGVEVFDFAQNCTNLESYGEKKIKLMCALIFGCDRKLSIFITINSNILIKGAIEVTKGNKTEGHTIWTKDELESTISNYINSNNTSLDVRVEELIRILLESKVLSFNANKYYMESVKKIDNAISKAVMMDCDLVMNLPANTRLTDDQFNVINNIVSDNKKVSILYGPGGTGKTYSIAELILVNSHIPTLIIAPTNIAALELTKSLLDSNVNMSKLIGGRVMSVDAYLCSDTLQHEEVDLIICDESSMMSTYHATIFQRTFKKIIMMGDNFQLNPVGSGAPFTDIIESELIKYNPLVKSMRTDNREITRSLRNLRDEDGCNLQINKVIPLAKSRSKENTKKGIDSIKDNSEESIRNINILIDTVKQRKDFKWIAFHNHVVDSLNKLLLGLNYGCSDNEIYESGKHLAMMTILNAKDAKQYNKLNFDLLSIDYGNYLGLELFWQGSTQKIDKDYQMCNSFPVIVADRNYFAITTIKYSQRDGASIKQVRMPINEFISRFNSTDHGELKLSYARTIHKSQGATYNKVAYIVKGDSRETKSYVDSSGKTNEYSIDTYDQSATYTAVSRAKSEVFTLSAHTLKNDQISVVPSSKRKTFLKMMLSRRKPL